jgi:hypothetical protein
VLARYATSARPSIRRRRFPADAAFAIAAFFDLLEAEGWDKTIRIKGNRKLYERIDWRIWECPLRTEIPKILFGAPPLIVIP